MVIQLTGYITVSYKYTKEIKGSSQNARYGSPFPHIGSTYNTYNTRSGAYRAETKAKKECYRGMNGRL